MRTTFLLAGAACAVALLPGCPTTDAGPAYVTGELANGVFLYECDSSSRECVDGHRLEFPQRVALETRFALEYEPSSGTTQVVFDVEAASSTLLELRPDGWRALQRGNAALLVRDGAGELQDFTFVEIDSAADVDVYVGAPGASATQTSRLADFTPLGPLELDLAAPVPLVAEAIASNGERLGGEPLLDMTCADDSIVTLQKPTRRPNWFELAPRAAGKTVCTLHALGFDKSFEVTVTGGTVVDGGTDAADDAATEEDAEVQQ